MKKKLLSLVLTFATLMSLLPTTVLAAELAADETTVVSEEVADAPEAEEPAETPDVPAAEDETPDATEAEEAPAVFAAEGDTEETASTYTFVVPSDATLLLTDTDMYNGLTEFEPVDVAENTPNGMTTYSFAAADAKTHCMFRVDGPDYITYAGSAYMAAGDSMTVTKQMLKPSGQTQTLLDRDPTSHGGVNVCDLYMNINSEGYLKMPSVGSRYQFVGLRNWWTSNVDWGLGAKYMWFQPNYHYTVLDEDGKPSNDVISMDENGIITANGNGTAIVMVTYDAINIAYDDKDASKGNGEVGHYESNGFFGALWPENTGVFVVTVGAGDSGIDKGTTLEFPDGPRAVDADFDVIYFAEETGTYNFTPATSGVTVSVANPKVGDYDECTSMSFSGFKTLTAKEDGSYDVPLTDGRNILKLEKDGKANYQVLNAKKTNITVNGMPLDECVVCAGDQISVKFDTLFNPLNRNQYINSDVAPMYYTLSGLPGKHAGTGRGPYGYYFFPGTEKKHTLSSFLLETDDGSQWHNPIVKEDGNLTIPEDYTGDSFDMTLGTFNTAGFGEIGGFRKNLGGFLDENGDVIKSQSSETATQDMAPGVFGYIAKLPDLSIPVSTLDSISVTTMPDKTVYKLEEKFNPAGMVVTARYRNGKTKDVTADISYALDSSTVGDKAVTISYTHGGVTKTTEITVNVNDISVTSVEITNPPTKTKYYPTEAFDPAGMVVVAHYSDGTSAELTTDEYTYAPSVFDNTAVNVPLTVTVGGKTATTPVTVDLIVKIELKAPLKSTELQAGKKFVPQNRTARILLTRGDGSSSTSMFAGWSHAAPINRHLTVYDNKVYVELPNDSLKMTGVAGLEPLIVNFTVTDPTGDMGTPITVYASCDDKGEWLVGTDGTTVKDIPLTVYDLNKDGKYTMVDAWVTLHHFYCPDDAAGYDEYINTSAYGSSATRRFWGCFQPDMIYTHNGEVVEDSSAELVDGDKITGHINADKKDLYTWFDQASYTATAGERKVFTVNGKYSADDWTAAPSGATVTVYNDKGEKQEDLSATVNADGDFAIRFPAAGTYTVEITGTCTYKDKNSTTVSAAVSPARCTVEVTSGGSSTPSRKSITAYLSLTENGEIATSGRTQLYQVPVEVYDTNGDGKFTISEAFQAFHTEYYSGGIHGYVENESTGWITRFWGEETSNLSYTLNNGWVYSPLTQIKDGDSLSMYFYEDTDNYSDLYTWFQPDEVRANVQAKKIFTVNGMSVMNSSETFVSKAAPVGADVTVYDENGKEIPELGTVTDVMGQFAITFPETGTYTVEVSGKCNYTCVAYDGSAGLHFDDATVIPSRCTVTVSNASGGTTVSASDAKAADAVDKLIEAIGTVTADSKAKIDAARNAYNKLTDAQKEQVKNYDTLVKAETELARINAGVTFVDVPAGSYYKDAVDWAVKKGVTQGVDATHFNPNGSCTRAQAVTFLWRAAGSPAPKSTEMPFKDVSANSYYRDAVLWAVENGITKGTSDTTFSPNQTCTRAQIVTFLWRSEKSPAASGSNPFADVAANAYYADAVLWAVENGVTKGTSDTAFSPDATCTRAQIVTFLWRCMK